MRLKTIAVMATLCLCTQAAHANSDVLAFFHLKNDALSHQSGDKPHKANRSQPDRSSAMQSGTGIGPAAGDVARLADQHGIPRNLALSVCKIESRCRYGMIGRAGERGPMQIKLQTARGLGYSGSAAGLNGHAGAYWGVKHLAVAYRKCGTARGAAKLHNAGLASSCSGSSYASRVVAGL
jgi:soluble lytic murein transglycosylase-like protein